ncbi:MAG: hypothetical protein PHH91_07790 [Desulfuromonadaceae bacterium]|nr:hypothetical protein [Desulfuromonadaceae bacterium]
MPKNIKNIQYAALGCQLSGIAGMLTVEPVVAVLQVFSRSPGGSCRNSWRGDGSSAN